MMERKGKKLKKERSKGVFHVYFPLRRFKLQTLLSLSLSLFTLKLQDTLALLSSHASFYRVL